MSSQPPASPPAATDAADGRETASYSRRAFVAAGGIAGIVSLAGCSTLTNLVSDAVLDDVIVLNGTEEPIAGTVDIVDPNGDTVLEGTFDLEATDGDEDRDVTEDLDSQTQFDDIWTDAGEYAASVELDDDLEGTSSGADAVTIEDPDEEHLAIGIGDAELAGVIGFRVFEDAGELE